MSILVRSAIALVAAACFACNLYAAALTPVLVGQTQAPGFALGVMTSGMSVKAIGDTVVISGATNDEQNGLWAVTTSGVERIAPELGGTCNPIYSVQSGAGSVAFLTYDDVHPVKMWSSGPGGTRCVLDGVSIPGLPGATINEIGTHGVTQDGRALAFVSYTQNSNQRIGLFAEQADGTMAPLAQEGMPAPGTVSTFAHWQDVTMNLDYGFPVMAGKHAVVFQAIAGDYQFGLWRHNGSQITPVFIDGQNVDGATVQVSDARDERISAKDTVVLRTYDNIFTNTIDGHSSLIAAAGSPAPGSEGNFYSLGAARINSSDQVAFYAAAEEARGLWITRNGGLELAIRADYDNGTDMGPLGRLVGIRCNEHEVDSGTGFALMDSGALVFVAYTESIINAGTEDEQEVDDTCLIAAYPNGTFDLLAKVGDQLEVAPGDFRTIDMFTIPSHPNGNGDNVYVNVEFDDYTQGIFVANVPEPTSLGLLAMGAFAVIRRRRR